MCIEVGATYPQVNVTDNFDKFPECDFGFSFGTKIFRYLSEERYLKMIESRINKIAHVTMWEDPFEAFIVRGGGKGAYHNQLKGIYGQCWTLHEKESDLRWRAYGERGKVVRLESTVGSLLESLKSLPVSIAQHCWVGRVGYVDESQLNKYIDGGGDDEVESLLISSMFVKRKEFAEEEEFRIVLNQMDEDRGLVTIENGLLNIPSVAFVKKVLFDPCMDDRRVDEIRCRSLSAGIDTILSDKSDLFHWPEIKRRSFQDEVAFDNSYAEFWKVFADKFKEMSGRRFPSRQCWCYDTRKGGAYNFVVTHKHARVELYIDSADRAQNKRLFDLLKEHADEIRQSVGQNVEFEALETKRAKRVKLEKEINMKDRGNWPQAIDFMTKEMPKFIAIVDKYLPDGGQ